MKKSKVLLWHWGRRGGGPRYTYELARGLIGLDTYDIHLSLSRQSEIFGACEKLDAPGFHIDTYHNLASAAFSTFRLPSIRRGFWHYIAEQEIDLLVCTMSHLWDVPMLFARRASIPFLLVLHDALPHPGDDILLRHWLLKQEISQSDGVLTLTQHVRNILCREYLYPLKLSWVAPHGVFSYGHGARQPHDSIRPIRLLFFGRILPYKGLDILLEAYGALRSGRHDVELVLSGPGDLAPYRAKLDSLPGITIDNRWIPEEDIGAIFEHADICVLPYREASQSGVIATAYASGLPVIVTPIGGLVEQVEHEKTGLVCRDSSPSALAESIARLLDDRALLQSCADGAARLAREELSWPSIAKRFSVAIDAMLADSSAKGAL